MLQRLFAVSNTLERCLEARSTFTRPPPHWPKRRKQCTVLCTVHCFSMQPGWPKLFKRIGVVSLYLFFTFVATRISGLFSVVQCMGREFTKRTLSCVENTQKTSKLKRSISLTLAHQFELVVKLLSTRYFSLDPKSAVPLVDHIVLTLQHYVRF